MLEPGLCVYLGSMRRCYRLLAAVAAATAFTLPPRVQTERLLQAQPPDSEERRTIDPVVGKAIVEKSGFFAAAIVLAILFEKFT